MIPKVLQKLEQHKATGIVVIPRWPTQVWYSMAMRMLISCPVLLQHNARLLLLPSYPQKGSVQFSATVAQAINFLADLVKSGVGYRGVTTARSAISTILVISDSATLYLWYTPISKAISKGCFWTEALITTLWNHLGCQSSINSSSFLPSCWGHFT